MIRLLLLGAVVFQVIVAAGERAPLVFVAIDAETEQRLGEFPLDRKLIAQAVERITRAGAKGILLKFFYDRPSNAESDAALERAVCAGRVALQASFNSQEGTTNELAPRFELKGSAPPEALSGDAALFPLPALMNCAKEIGFVDFVEASKAPLMEKHRGKLVKSLYLVGLEMAIDSRAEILDGQVRAGNRKFKIDATGSVAVDLSKEPKFETVAFHDILNDLASWKTKLQGAVVVVGYDGPKIHKIKTPQGERGAHRFFIETLGALLGSVTE